MGIQSTMYISRETAIDRILKIAEIKSAKDYREMEKVTGEDYSVSEFIDDGESFNVDKDTLERWTDEMLTDKMDESFFRLSIFDNYLIEENED